MRTVKKETIDRLLEAVDEYGKTFDYAGIDSKERLRKYRTAHNWAKIASEEIHGNSFYGSFDFSLVEFVCSLRIIHPIKYCTNEEVYAILKMLDIEVVEEESE